MLTGPLLLRAGAATATVTLNSNGPTPQRITINRGDRVTFVNQDTGSHTITNNAGAWTFRATIRPGASATTPSFSSGGQFGYSDVFFIAVVQQNVNGFITVRAPSSTASPTPKPSATRSPTPKPKPSATRGPTPQPAASSASPTSSPTPSGVAIVPGIGGLPSIITSGGPTPNVAPPESAQVSGTPAVVAYGPKSEIAQSSAHRYGLPVVLALVAVVGVLSLLVRLLLAEPAATTGDAASRRTEEEGPEAGL